MSAFDVATAIDEFLMESDRTSFELPHMTTGERKSTKKLLEKYSEVRCESYGFGAERKLTLFKKSMLEASQDSKNLDQSHTLAAVAVSIKNTFIDGWAAPTPEPVVFRSLQNVADSRGLDFAAIVKMSRKGEVEITSADGSNTATNTLAPAITIPTFGDSPSASPRLQRGASTAPMEVQVRNTFVHFEDLVRSNERAVQSMPHGMFKQCILAEASQGGQTTPTTTSGYNTPTTISEQEVEFMPSAADTQVSVGALVVVEGLLKAPAFNGCTAVVQGWDEEAKRYNILFASTGGSQTAKIKEENLRVMLPCP